MDWQAIQDFLQQHEAYIYLIIIGWTFLEGETIVIIAGFLAQKGMFGLHPLFITLCAFAGSFCSDQVMFCLGKYKGPAVLKRFPRLSKNTEKVRRLIVKYETPLILGFRFVYGIRNATPIMLGTSGVKHAKFIFLNMFGALVWAFAFSYGGYYFGELFEQVSGNVKNAEKWLIGGVVVIVLALYLRHRHRAKKNVQQVLDVTGLKPELRAKPIEDEQPQRAAQAAQPDANSTVSGVKPAEKTEAGKDA